MEKPENHNLLCPEDLQKLESTRLLETKQDSFHKCQISLEKSHKISDCVF